VRTAAVLLILGLNSLLLHQRGLGLVDFHPIGIGVLGQLSKLSEIGRGLLVAVRDISLQTEDGADTAIPSSMSRGMMR
jgi:hypothetical protein